MLAFSALILLAAFIGFSRSWDVAVTTSDSKLLYFHSNGTLADTAQYKGSELSALAYDATKDMLLLVEERNSTYNIYGITSKNKSELIRTQNGTVSSVAYDPITSTLFWIAGIVPQSRSIYKMSVRNSNEVSVLKRNKRFTGIAVDSCGGYVYWAEFALSESIIKRSKFDGSNEAKVVDVGLFAPIGLAVDHSARSLYWTDDAEGIPYKVESSDLQGGHRRTVAQGTDQEPRNIAVGDHRVFWSENLKNGVWGTPKNASNTTAPVQILDFEGKETLKGLAVRYSLATQNGIPSCSEFKFTPYEQKFEAVNAHPKLMSTIRPQKAKPSYIQTPPDTTSSFGEPRMGLTNEIPKIPQEISEAKSKTEYSTSDEFYVEAAGCTANDQDIKDPIIMALGTLCGLLCVACAVLLTKIMQLKRRPRIKKRIIVNKNVTPLTARPEQQCEITIENCCNMNICETPCFEPRSTIRPTFLGTKAGKDEKRNLIGNMEHPDDIY